MRFGLLGPLLVEGATGRVVLGSALQRALLAVLLVEEPGRVVAAARLIDELWGSAPPATASKSLQGHVSLLRRALGSEQPIVSRPRGYGLHVDPWTVDLHRFKAGLAEAHRLRAADHLEQALRVLVEALGLWRGPALADVTLHGPGASEAARLEQLRSLAREERLELELALGAHAALVPELEALIAETPYREHAHGLLMLALYRGGRQAEALAAFRHARALLVDDLGLEPGPELVRLERAILSQDPGLEVQARTPGPAFSATPSGEAPASPCTGALLGRDHEVRELHRLIARPDVRLITLTGAGGIGKTRLALELVGQLVPAAGLSSWRRSTMLIVSWPRSPGSLGRRARPKTWSCTP